MKVNVNQFPKQPAAAVILAAAELALGKLMSLSEVYCLLGQIGQQMANTKHRRYSTRKGVNRRAK